MVNVRDIAEVIRTKNAGPYIMTADIIIRDYDTYQKVKEAQAITRERIAQLYGISVEDVLGVLYFDEGRTIKTNIRRMVTSGDIGDTDVSAMQQHAPLLSLEFAI